MKRVFWGSVIGVLFLLQTEVVFAMSLIGFKVCLASEMKATVTYEGKPATGAVVTRMVNFNNKDYTTETRTDDAGRFVLPALYDRTLWKHTPFETRMWQTVNIVYRGESHLGLELSKQNFDEDGEFNDPVRLERGLITFAPYKFTCELTDVESNNAIYEEFSGFFTGKCKLLKENARTPSGQRSKD